MAWRVARSLIVLRTQIDQAWPSRSTASDGTIADSNHSSTSDHAPHNFPGWGDEIVTARDITHDPGRGADMGAVAEALRASQDYRIKYVIWGNRMYSSYSSGGVAPWFWRGYSGTFHSHLHVSVVGDPRADQEHPWQIGVVDMALSYEQDNALAETWAVSASVRDGAGVIRTDTHPGGPNWMVEQIRQLIVAAAGNEVRELALSGAVQALSAAMQAGGGTADPASILATVNDYAKTARSTIEALQEIHEQQITALRAELTATQQLAADLAATLQAAGIPVPPNVPVPPYNTPPTILTPPDVAPAKDDPPPNP